MVKKLLASFLVLSLFTVSASAVDLYVDTNKIETDTPPTIVDGRTLVPVRAIFEAIGATVTWDGATRTATGVRDDTTVIIQIGNKTAYVNGEPKTLNVPAQIINGRTMVPARFISEAMGCDVTWYADTKTVGVADKTKGQHIYVTKTGKKYHYSETCNGGTYYEATLAEAMGRGLTPCDKCVLTAGVEEELLFAKEHIRFYYTGYEKNSDGYTLNVRVENDSDYTITGRIAPDPTVNSKKVPVRLTFTADPGRTANGTITIKAEDLEKAGISDVKTVKVAFSIRDAKNLPYEIDFGTGFITINLKK